MPDTTPLSLVDELLFHQWLKDSGITDANEPDSYYDYRGLFKQMKGVPLQRGPGQHLTDQFKQHGHPTFSIESQYSKGPNDGGTWQGDTLIPSPQPMNQQQAQNLLVDAILKRTIR